MRQEPALIIAFPPLAHPPPPLDGIHPLIPPKNMILGNFNALHSDAAPGIQRRQLSDALRHSENSRTLISLAECTHVPRRAF